MDPLSALSIAASVVQFTDFTLGLLSNAKEVYDSASGRSQENTDLLQVGRDLVAMTTGIENRLEVSQGPTKDIFIQLCDQCREISQKLQQAVDKIQPVNGNGIQRAFLSFTTALKCVWSSSDIQILKQQLSRIRERMMLAAVMLLCEQGRSRNSEESPILYSKKQVDLLRDKNEKDEVTRKFHEEFSDLILPSGRSHNGFPHDTTTRISRTIRMLWDSDIWTEFIKEDPTVKRDGRACDSVCNSLVFQSLTQREEAIPQAYSETFDWIFKPPRQDDNGGALWSDFPEWLESCSRDMFWITGKPGAGKSTLMKHIAQNARYRTEQHLGKWSSGLPLLVAGFYFWNAGNQLQKTHTGLMRTLLQQCVSQMPDLVVELFPRRYTILRIMGPHARLPEWDLDEIYKSFESLLELAGTNFNLALFIDGLDEFEGDHHRLVEQLRMTNKSCAVKVCVSSRPWNVFRDAFQRIPSLRLEDLTSRDIETFVRGQFRESRGFAELEVTFPSHSSKLVSDLVAKAQGVFLWVNLVVKALLQNLQDGDNVSQLQITLQAFPTDIEALYERIWTQIQPKFEADRARYCTMLELAIRLDEPLSLQYIWLADEESYINRQLPGVENISDESWNNAMKLATRRLNSRTLMLLDVFPGYRVDYLHRTARDWLLSRWDRVRSKMPDNFNAGLVLLEAALDLMSATRTARITRKLLHISQYSAESRVSLLMRLVQAAEQAPQAQNRATRLFSAINRIDTEMGRLIDDPCIHWACSPHGTQDIAAQHNNCFVIFCARFGLAGYVKWRSGQDSKVLNHHVDDPMHNVLGGACVGLADDPSLPKPQFCSGLLDNEKGREDLVVFTLEQRRVSKAVRATIMKRGLSHEWATSLAFQRLQMSERKGRIGRWFKGTFHK